MDRKTVAEVEISGHTILVRVDFNVPLKDGQITDDTRIVAALDTINYLRERGGKVILCSHLGRPKGKPDPQQSLAPCAAALSARLGAPVRFVPDCLGEDVSSAVAEMLPGDVILLENTRFYPGEESKEETEMLAFAKQLAAPADMFVNDAFGSSHRKHASVYGVTRFLSPCVGGFLIEKEVTALTRLLQAPEQGFVAVIGGAKVQDKIGTIKSLLTKVEKLLIGGAMAWAFFKAQGKEIGGSLCDDKSLAAARDIMDTMGEYLPKLSLPQDVHMQKIDEPSETAQVGAEEIRPEWSALDIGPQTGEAYAAAVLAAENVFWNGPMGKFEEQPFDQGTLTVAKAVAECPGFTVVGGGDSVAAITQMGVADQVDHVSTGGGASLEFIEFGSLPGVDVLDKK
ncbi:MAG: phosphoglycerate kinase [candidate division WS1 bacterium]|nr:phosphoglycerate kinase [candidate division WS1 bacterium]